MLIPLRENLSGLVVAGKKIRESKFARDAAWLLLFNFVAKGLSFIGGAHAAKCLGPVNLGISALVQTTASQVGLLYNGGLDPVVVRRIAADKACASSLAAVVVTFRLIVAAAALIVWAAAVMMFVPQPRQTAWLVGGLLMLTTGASVIFAFQGLERLPVQNAIAAGTSLVMAAVYLTVFRPGMPLGSDLAVLVVVGLASTAASWWFYRRAAGAFPVGRAGLEKLGELFRESWRYWLLSLVCFFYTLFQFPLISHFLGEGQTGVYRSSYLLAAGVETIFGSITSLLLPRMVVWKKQGSHVMRAQQRRLFKIFLLIGLPITGAMMLSAPFIYRVFFGSAYLDGIKIFQILVMGRLMVFIGQIYLWGVVAAGMDTEFLLITILGSVFSLVSNLFIIPAYGLPGAAVVSVLTEIIIGAAGWFLLRWSVREGG